MENDTTRQSQRAPRLPGGRSTHGLGAIGTLTREGGAFTKENNQRVRQLALEEETALAKEIPEVADWSKLVVALHTGLRRGEQFRLRWEDVDFRSWIVTIPDSKSGEAHHIIPMNDTVRTVLRALPSRLKSPWAFPSETGETPSMRKTSSTESSCQPCAARRSATSTGTTCATPSPRGS